MSAIQRSLVSDQVFKSLIGDILSGSYAPGEKLPTQRALAADLGVNMASVREAVKRLEQMRLIEVRQGDAMRVQDWRTHGGLDVIVHALVLAGGLDRSTLGDLLEGRRILLVQIARLAAERRSDRQVGQLRQLVGAFSAAESATTRQELDWQFYTELAEAAGNLIFRLVMNNLRDLYFEQARLFEAVVAEPESLKRSMEEVIDAVEAGDADRAADVVEWSARTQEEWLLDSLTPGRKR